MSEATLTADLKRAVGDAGVLEDPERISKAIRDNSWLSPVLSEHLSLGGDTEEALPDVAAVVTPHTLGELRALLAHLYAHRSPIVIRGGGTTNFGQTTPLAGGVVVDTSRLSGNIEVGPDWVEADAGTLQGDLDDAAAEHGRELTVMTTTYASCTIGGWVCGGHVGLGTNAYGTIWDGNVLALDVCTVEAEPRTVRLEGGEVLDALHAYGTTGVVTRVRVPTAPRRDWREAVASFSDYWQATAFVAGCAARGVRTRVAAAQEAPLLDTMTPLRRLGVGGSPGVLLIVDREDWDQAEACAAACGGQLHAWEPGTHGGRGPSIGLMVYGHRMLWIKKRFPEAAFMHIYFRKGREQAQQHRLKDAAGDRLLLELKYMASPWLSAVTGQRAAGPLPAAVLTVADGHADLASARRICTGLGIRARDPHTFALSDSGVAPHIATLLDAKAVRDPAWLLNPGKLAGDDEAQWKEAVTDEHR